MLGRIVLSMATTDQTGTDSSGATTLTADGDASKVDPAKADASAPGAAGDDAANKAEAAKAAVGADVAVKLPDGVQADDVLLGKFIPLAKELGLKSEGAQKLADLFIEAQKGWTERANAEGDKLRKGWVDELKSDKDFGGANFDANAQSARKAVMKYATKEERAWLDETGLGDAPQLVRMMARIGKAIAEDSIAGATAGNGAVTAAQSEGARLRAMYPNSPEMFPKE